MSYVFILLSTQFLKFLFPLVSFFVRYRIVALKFSQRYFLGGNLYLQACKKIKTLKELKGQCHEKSCSAEALW